MRWSRALIAEGVGTLAVLVVVLSAFARFVTGIERRQGAVLDDPLLALFSPLDATWPVFIALYALLITAIVSLLRRPHRLMAGAQAYALMVLLRMVAMYLTPLDPPPTMIPLEDPIVRLFGPSQVLTRDLFFSGHTASCVLVLLAVANRKVRAVLAVLALVVAGGVLAQHVHYAADVLAAVPFAFFAWSLTLWLRRRLNAAPLETS